MPTLAAPTPTVGHARQFFTAEGEEIFFSEAYGRRADVKDALRCMGSGPDRASAQKDALQNWQSAWRSLHPGVR